MRKQTGTLSWDSVGLGPENFTRTNRPIGAGVRIYKGRKIAEASPYAKTTRPVTIGSKALNSLLGTNASAHHPNHYSKETVAAMVRKFRDRFEGFRRVGHRSTVISYQYKECKNAATTVEFLAAENKEQLLHNESMCLRKEGAWKAATAAVTQRYMNTPRKTEEYRGIIKETHDSYVLVTVSSPGDWDKWNARIPLASFNETPKDGQEFSCTISIQGSDISIRARILPHKQRRTLKDFGIDEHELLEWASKLDL